MCNSCKSQYAACMVKLFESDNAALSEEFFNAKMWRRWRTWCKIGVRNDLVSTGTDARGMKVSKPSYTGSKNSFSIVFREYSTILWNSVNLEILLFFPKNKWWTEPCPARWRENKKETENSDAEEIVMKRSYAKLPRTIWFCVATLKQNQILRVRNAQWGRIQPAKKPTRLVL